MCIRDSPTADQKSVLERILDTRLHAKDDSPKLMKASFFYQFYMARALEHAGMADRYVGLLQPWREMLAKGLTTTPEFDLSLIHIYGFCMRSNQASVTGPGCSLRWSARTAQRHH